MAEVADLPGCEGTFVGAELELRVSETLEDLAEGVKVLLPGSGEDNDVVQVEEAGFPVETGQDAVHESGEGSRIVAEDKGNLVKLEQLAAAGAEGCLLLVPFLDRDLPVSALEIKSGEPTGPMKCVEEVVDARNGMRILHHRRIELPEVHTEPQAAVLFFTMTTGEAQGLLEGRMTPLDSICWTWAISSR